MDIIIVGGGPAGFAAAIYARRAGLSVTLLERLSAGGQMATTPDIENYPGIPRTAGYELAFAMENQARELGTEIQYTDVTKLTIGSPHEVQTAGKLLTCRALILAMGATRRTLGCAGEAAFTGRGVSYCATCDGSFFKGQTVAVVGGGNTALEDALYMAGLGCEVYVIHRRTGFRGNAILEERVHREPRIKLLLEQTVTAIEGNQKVERIVLTHAQTRETTSIPVAGVFIAVGVLPQTELVRDILPLTASGHVAADETCHTPFAGVFVAGDLRQKPLYQIVTACSDGAVAASAAAHFLQ